MSPRAVFAPPEPADAEFVALVRRNLAEADAGARAEAGTVAPRMQNGSAPRPAAPTKPAPPRERETMLGGKCWGCGCDHDDRTEGCPTCKGRHAQRDAAARNRAERERRYEQYARERR